MKLGRASNLEDLLERAPGVFLQSENGAEVSEISIRGSGITSEDEPIGVMFLLDPLCRCLLARRIPSWISPLQRAFDFSRLYKPD